MNTPNPWSVVQASDYEEYMGPEGLDQLGPLAALFQEVVLSTQPDRLLLLGCATGNGLDHVDPAVTRQVVGVDVNLQYLGIARQRFFQLGPRLELYNADVLAFRAAKGPFDLVHAALLLEYVEPGALVGRFSEWLGPKGTCSVVLELAGGDGPEPPSRALKLIARAANHVDPDEFKRRCALVGLALLREKQVPLKHGRRFWHGVFGRNIRRPGA